MTTYRIFLIVDIGSTLSFLQFVINIIIYLEKTLQAFYINLANYLSKIYTIQLSIFTQDRVIHNLLHA